jgi:hypothetical protein
MKEINEESKLIITPKTLGIIVGIIAAAIGAFYAYDASIDSKIDEKLQSIKVGKGFYQVDPGDPAAKETWPASRPESDMKLQLYGEYIEDLKRRVERLEQK